MPVSSCRFFNGYKPCDKNAECSFECPHLDTFDEVILVIHLGALGAVVRSTALISPIKKKHPNSKIVWVTEANAAPLLKSNPWIDLVLTPDLEGLLTLKTFEFGTAYIIDKSLKASGIAKQSGCKKVF